jgi:hypothetical protein
MVVKKCKESAQALARQRGVSREGLFLATSSLRFPSKKTKQNKK